MNHGKAYLINGEIVDVYCHFREKQNPKIFDKLSKVNDILVHRENEPAIIWDYDFLDKYYYIQNGLLHRLDGPAKTSNIKSRNRCSDNFYIEGNPFSGKDFSVKTDHLICNLCKCFCKQECFA